MDLEDLKDKNIDWLAGKVDISRALDLGFEKEVDRLIDRWRSTKAYSFGIFVQGWKPALVATHIWEGLKTTFFMNRI